MDITAQILGSLPTYGPMYESVPKGNLYQYSEGLVVKFESKDKESKVFNFAKGARNFNHLSRCIRSNYHSVVSGGEGYVINPFGESPPISFGGNINKLIDDAAGRKIYADYNQLYIVESSGHVWTSIDIATDGLENLSLKEDLITGEAGEPGPYTFNWIEFSYDLKLKTVTFGRTRKEQ